MCIYRAYSWRIFTTCLEIVFLRNLLRVIVDRRLCGLFQATWSLNCHLNKTFFINLKEFSDLHRLYVDLTYSIFPRRKSLKDYLIYFDTVTRMSEIFFLIVEGTKTLLFLNSSLSICQITYFLHVIVAIFFRNHLIYFNDIF